MKILTDKVYLKGQEFIVNNWPGEPKKRDGFQTERYIVHMGGDFGYEKAMNKYKSALTRAIEEGYVVQTHFYELLPTQDPLTARSHQFYTLPEPREFEIAFHINASDLNDPGDLHYLTNPRINRMTAILLPKKEEIKPAPLGEEINPTSFEERVIMYLKDLQARSDHYRSKQDKPYFKGKSDAYGYAARKIKECLMWFDKLKE